MSERLQELLAGVMVRLKDSYLTFTEAAALQPLWDIGYELVAEETPFVLARPADGKAWMLTELWLIIYF